MHKCADQRELLAVALGHAANRLFEIQFKAVGQLLDSAAIFHAAIAGEKADKRLAAHFRKQRNISGEIAERLLNHGCRGEAISSLNLAGAGSGADKAHEMTDGRCFSGCVRPEKAEYFACIDGKGQIENTVSVPVVAGQTGDINAVHFFLLYIKNERYKQCNLFIILDSAAREKPSFDRSSKKGEFHKKLACIDKENRAKIGNSLWIFHKKTGVILFR